MHEFHWFKDPLFHLYPVIFVVGVRDFADEVVEGRPDYWLLL